MSTIGSKNMLRAVVASNVIGSGLLLVIVAAFSATLLEFVVLVERILFS